MMANLPAHIAYGQRFSCAIRCNLSHSGANALSLQQLLALDNAAEFAHFQHQPLQYASIKGAFELREQIVDFHCQYNESCEHISPEHVLTFSGAQEALAAIYQSVLSVGDEVVVFTPNYPSLTAMVKKVGARLVELPLSFNHQWQFDIDALKQRVSNKTKLLVINAPHNPSGAMLTTEQQQQILTIAKQANCYLLCDDVSQHLVIEPSSKTAHPFFSYDKTIAVSVMSKSLGLGGIRIGWAVTTDKLLMDRLVSYKAYSSICTSLVDEQLASIALKHSDEIIANNTEIVRKNVSIFKQFIAEKKGVFAWHPPKAGLLSLVRVNVEQPIMTWAPKFTQASGVMILPSELFGLSGNYFRLGLGQANFALGIEQLSQYALFN